MRFSVLVTEAMHAAGVTNVTVPPSLATTRPHSARLALLDKSMSRGLGEQGASGDTRSIVLELALLRAERAALLGFPHHAALVSAESAARTTEAVSELLGRFTPPAMANARADAPSLRRSHGPGSADPGGRGLRSCRLAPLRGRLSARSASALTTRFWPPTWSCGASSPRGSSMPPTASTASPSASAGTWRSTCTPRA